MFYSEGYNETGYCDGDTYIKKFLIDAGIADDAAAALNKCICQFIACIQHKSEQIQYHDRRGIYSNKVGDNTVYDFNIRKDGSFAS